MPRSKVRHGKTKIPKNHGRHHEHHRRSRNRSRSPKRSERDDARPRSRSLTPRRLQNGTPNPELENQMMRRINDDVQREQFDEEQKLREMLKTAKNPDKTLAVLYRRDDGRTDSEDDGNPGCWQKFKSSFSKRRGSVATPAVESPRRPAARPIYGLERLAGVQREKQQYNVQRAFVRAQHRDHVSNEFRAAVQARGQAGMLQKFEIEDLCL